MTRTCCGACECIDPLPIVTVAPVISPNVYRGGTVVTRVAVDKRGGVARVEVLSPVPALVDRSSLTSDNGSSHRQPADEQVPGSTNIAVHVILVRTVSPPSRQE